MTADFKIKGFTTTSMVDWPGKICSVVFLGGCGFRCPACHNCDLVLRPDSLPDLSLEGILEHIADRKDWIDGVTITGGEPTQHRNLPALLTLFKAQGLRIKLDTNGSRPATLAMLIGEGLLDAVYMDVKAPLTARAYSRVAGVYVEPSIIAAAIAVLKSSGLEIAFRTTVIPGVVEEPELAAIKRALGTVERFMVQPFRNRQTLNSEFATIREFPPERVEEMRTLFEVPNHMKQTWEQYARAG